MALSTGIESKARERTVPVGELGTSLARARCLSPGQVDRMKQSLATHGQLTAVVALDRKGELDVVDGFKRRAAAQAMGWPTLRASVRELDETGQWVTMLALNRGSQTMMVLEEALVLREIMLAGHTQVEIAGLVGRHKTWVSRRIGLVERLHPELVEWVRTGILAPGTARRLMVLPAGNQLEWAAVVCQEDLGTEQTEILLGLWHKTSDPEVRRFLMSRPWEALAHARPGETREPLDPRLSPRGQGLQRSLRILRGVGQRVERGLCPPPPLQDLTILRPELSAVEQTILRVQRAVGSVVRQGICAGESVPSATPTSGTT